MAIRANKKLGQHFLTDYAVIDNIISAIAPKEGENLLEIGPGMGAITIDILEQAKKLTVIEKDRRMVPILKTKSVLIGDLNIIEQDVLSIDYKQILTGDSWKVFGNLPYNISTAIMLDLCKQKNISQMVFMVQKEVADRVSAESGCRAYGRLSVILNQTHKVQTLFDVQPNAFSPPPKVMSSVILMQPRETLEYQVDNQENFEKIVKASFAMKRKTIRNNLKKLISADELESLEINPSERAEQMEGKLFARISNYLNLKQEK